MSPCYNAETVGKGDKLLDMTESAVVSILTRL